MESNAFYVYLKKRMENGQFVCYDLCYKIELPKGVYAKSWSPELAQVSRNKYEANFEDTVDQVENIVELVTSETIPDHEISTDGSIQVIGISADPPDTQKITLRPKAGGASGNGSTVHFGDAD